MRAVALALLVALSGCLAPSGDEDPPPGPAAAPAWEWGLLPDAPGVRTEASAVHAAGRVFVLGGIHAGAGPLWEARAAVDVLDLASGAWSKAPDLPVPLHHAAVVALGSKVVVLGGYAGPSFTPLAEAWQLDAERVADGWTSFPSLPAARGAHAAATDGERIWVFGGFAGAMGLGPMAEAGLDERAWVFEGGSWRAIAPFPSPREHLAGGFVDGRVVAVGGRALSFETNTGRVDVYDPATDAWSVGAPMPVARGGIGAGVAGGRLVVVGGETADRALDDVTAYDARADAWGVLPPMPEARHGVGVATVPGGLLVATGGSEPGFTYSATVQRLSVR